MKVDRERRTMYQHIWKKKFCFWERNHHRCIIQDVGKSTLTKLTMSGGTDCTQIESGKEKQALLARASATSFPSLSVRESNQLFKEFKWDRVSMRRWPRSELNIMPFFRVLMTISKSPSRMELSKPTSLAKRAARLATINSKTGIDYGFWIFSESEATTLPLEFLMTTLILASPESLKMAPSKFVL